MLRQFLTVISLVVFSVHAQAAATPAAKQYAAWSATLEADSSSDTESVVHFPPKFTDSEFAYAIGDYQTDTPGEARFLATLHAVHWDKRGSKLEGDVDLTAAGAPQISDSDRFELVGVSKNCLYFSWGVEASVDTPIGTDTVITTATDTVSLVRFYRKGKTYAVAAPVVVGASAVLITTVKGVTTSVTGTLEEPNGFAILSNAATVVGRTATYKSSVLGTWSSWAKSFDLKLAKSRATYPSFPVPDVGFNGYDNTEIPSSRMVFTQTNVDSDTQETTYSVIVYGN